MTDISTELPSMILQARDRIKNYVRKTPLECSPYLSSMAPGSNVYIKLESEQVTGSFKSRGAFNKLLKQHQEAPDSLSKGVVTASTGNHGMACLKAANTIGCPLEIVCQENVQSEKLAALKAYGATLVLHGNDCVEAETYARTKAAENNLLYVSPYNDIDVVAGQGTIGVEILEDLPNVDVVLVPVGGGGMIAGIARHLKSAKPTVKVIGCQPSQSKVMYESVKAGKIIWEESGYTLSDATSGGIEEGSITFELCRDFVDEWIMTTEDQVAAAIYFMLESHHKLVEGSAGVALGAFMSQPKKFAGQTVAIISCGCNIGCEKILNILQSHCKYSTNK